MVLQPVYHYPACGVAFEIGSFLDYPHLPYQVARTYLDSGLAVELRAVVHLQVEGQGIFRARALRAALYDGSRCGLGITGNPFGILRVHGD